MTSLSITSDRFIKLHEQVKPPLEAASQRSFQTTMRLTMPAFFPGDVLSALAGVRATAEEGIHLAGAGMSQVTLTHDHQRMLQWALAGDFD